VVNFEQFLRLLSERQINFVVIGGLAASVHGSAYATYDIDICYARDDDNLQKLVNALQPIHPYLRGAPPGLPFKLDAPTLKAGLNFTLSTEPGDIDLLGEVAGIGFYDRVLKQSDEVIVFGIKCRALSLEGLIQSKRAAGRSKDLNLIPELETLLALKRKQQGK
jgi:predicted nucleotidyltransferase